MNTGGHPPESQPIRSRWLREVKALVDATAYTEALAPARDYVRQKPNDPSGHVMLGMVYQRTGRLRQGRAGT